MSALSDWLAHHHFFHDDAHSVSSWLPSAKSYAATQQDTEDDDDDGVPSTWSDFASGQADAQPHQFKRLCLRYRFVPPVHQPSERAHQQFEHKPRPEPDEAATSAYLQELKRLGVNPTFYGVDRQLATNATHDMSRRTNSPTARPRPTPYAWDIWYS